jgi:uncharacterized protein (TIGR02996 family)
MRDTEAALLAAIVANPDDDAVRLVYADWLDEQEAPTARQREAMRARAAFIRLEIEMAGMMTDNDRAPNDWEQPRFRGVEAQAGELYNRFQRDWFGHLDQMAKERQTQRGFMDHIALPARMFIAHGEEIFRLAPTIRNVFIAPLGRNMPALAQCPALRHVRELVFFETPFRAKEAEALAGSPYLGNLKSLEIPYTDTRIGPRGARALAQAQTLTALECLDLGNHAIYDEGATALLRAGRFATLHELDLGNNGLTNVVADALAAADHLTQLRRLDLMRNYLSALGVELLVLQARHLAALEHLNLSGSNLADRGARLLAQGFPRLRSLHLSNCSIGDAGCAAVLAMPALKRLSLSDNRPQSSAFAALAGAGSPLEELSLMRCGVGAVEVGALGKVASLPALRSLDLDGNELMAEGMRRFLEGPLVCGVERLSVEKCRLGNEGAEALASCPGLATLRILHLGDNEISDRGALALVRSPHLSGLRSVWLRDNPLKEKTKEAICERYGKDGCWV